MKFLMPILMLLAPTYSIAGSTNFSCTVFVMDSSYTATTHSFTKNIEFSEQDLAQSFTFKEIVTKDDNTYSVVSNGNDNLSLYKIETSTGKTKQIISIDKIVSLNDVENHIAVVCK